MAEKLSRSEVDRYHGLASSSNISALLRIQRDYINNISTVSSKLNDLDFSTWDDTISSLTFSRCNDLKNSYYSTISKNIEDTSTSPLGKLVKAIENLKEKCESYITWDNKTYSFPTLNEDDKKSYSSGKSSVMTQSARDAVEAYNQNLRTKETNLQNYSDKIREILAHISGIDFDQYGTNAEDSFDYSVVESEEVAIPPVDYSSESGSTGDGTYLNAPPPINDERRRKNSSNPPIAVGWSFTRFGYAAYQGTRTNSLDSLRGYFNEYNVGQRFTFIGAEYFNTGVSWGYSPRNYGTFTYIGNTQVNRFGLTWKDTTYPIFQGENGKYYTIIEDQNLLNGTTCFKVQEVHPRNNKNDFHQQAYFDESCTTTITSESSSSDFDNAVNNHQNVVVTTGGTTKRYVYDVGTGKYYETDQNGHYNTSTQKGYKPDKLPRN